MCLGAAASLLRLEREAAELSFWMQSDAMWMQIGRIGRLQQVQAQLGVVCVAPAAPHLEGAPLAAVRGVHTHTRKHHGRMSYMHMCEACAQRLPRGAKAALPADTAVGAHDASVHHRWL